MPDNIPTPPSGAAPQISESGLAYYRERLADQAFARDFPDQFARFKSTVDQALSVTGQSLEKSAPQMTAEAQHVASYGLPVDPKPADYSNIAARNFQRMEAPEAVDFAQGARQFASALQLPPYLASALASIHADTPDEVDPDQVRAVIERGGKHKYADLIAEVDQMIAAGEKRLGATISVRAKDFAPMALLQLALHSRTLARAAATMPKGKP